MDDNTILSELNEFMKTYDIEQIDFGKTHSIKRTDTDKADDIYKNKKKKL